MSIYELLRQVAFHLVGEPIIIRFKNHEHFIGITRRDIKTSLLTVDLRTHFSSEKEFLRVLLHELSHCKNHNFIPSNIEAPAGAPVPDSMRKKIKETQADTEAEVWLSYAINNRNKSFPFMEGCLLTLLNHKEQ